MYTTPAKQNTAQFSLQNTFWKTKKEKNMKHILETSYTPHISFCSMTQNRLAKILPLFVMNSKGWRLQGKGPLHKRNQQQLIFAEMEYIPLDSHILISLGHLWEVESYKENPALTANQKYSASFRILTNGNGTLPF